MKITKTNKQGNTKLKIAVPVTLPRNNTKLTFTITSTTTYKETQK